VSADRPKNRAGPARTSQLISIHRFLEDNVDISTRRGEIAGILAAIDLLPDVRYNKVREIKQRIEARTYVVDPCKVAEKMLEDNWNYELTE
jgi:flagellar biosynthesis anti-sigma factor FlgM